MKISPNRYKEIGGKIKEARENKKMSQRTLAEAIGFESGVAISLLEAGERKVSIIDLEKIADALNENIETFLGYKEKSADVRFALRADKNLNEADKEAILRFIDLAKAKKHGKRTRKS